MEFSKRLDLFGDEVFAALNARRRELEAQGRRVFDLSVGTPDFRPPEHVVEALRASAADPESWKYSLHDTDELLDAVCAYYEDRYGVAGITRDMVMSCRGTQEGLVHVCSALVDAGDVALVPDPCYPVFQNATLLAGARPHYYRLTAEHDFLPHLADVPAEVADAAKYLIVSLPANPVGSVGTPEVYEQVIAFAREHDLIVIHDNAYSDIVFDGPAGGSFLSYPGALDVGVEFLSLSKSFNVTGARLSFLVGRPDVVAAARKLRSQIDFGMFYPEQAAAVAALTGPRNAVERQRLLFHVRVGQAARRAHRLGGLRARAHGARRRDRDAGVELWPVGGGLRAHGARDAARSAARGRRGDRRGGDLGIAVLVARRSRN